MENKEQLFRIEQEVSRLKMQVMELSSIHLSLQAKLKDKEEELAQKNKQLLEQEQIIKDFQTKLKKAKIAGITELEDGQKLRINELLNTCMKEIDHLVTDIDKEIVDRQQIS